MNHGLLREPAPGWSPAAIDALTNLTLLKDTRGSAYATFYFADKMLNDYETLADTSTLSKSLSDAVNEDIKKARSVLGESYETIPKVVRELVSIQEDFKPIEEGIVSLRKKAIAANKDKVMLQRFFSSALTLVGGVAKGLPIGQPFLGAAGGLGSIGEFDWNSDKPLDSARSAFASLGGKVTTFVESKRSAVEEAVTRDLDSRNVQNASLLTALQRSVQDEETELEQRTAEAETNAQTFKTDELAKLTWLITDTQVAIEAAKKNSGSQPSVDAAVKLSRSVEETEVAWSASSANRLRGRLHRQLVEYQRRQTELEEYRRTFLKAKDDGIKKLAKKLQFSNDRVSKATRTIEDSDVKIAAPKKAAGDLMDKLSGLGEGLTEAGGAVVSMLTPVSDADPDVVRLTEQMLVERSGNA